MEQDEVTAYSFGIDIYRDEDGQYQYGVFQEFDTEDEEESLQLLESGGAATLAEAAEMAGNSIRTLFVT